MTRRSQASGDDGDSDDDPAYDPADGPQQEESDEENNQDSRQRQRSSTPAPRVSQATGNATRPFARRTSTGAVPSYSGGGGASSSARAGGASSSARVGGASSSARVGGASSSARSGGASSAGRIGGERFISIDQSGREVKVGEINSTMMPKIVVSMLRDTLDEDDIAQVAGLLLSKVNSGKLVSLMFISCDTL